jgi:hypothetical protein
LAISTAPSLWPSTTVILSTTTFTFSSRNPSLSPEFLLKVMKDISMPIARPS